MPLCAEVSFLVGYYADGDGLLLYVLVVDHPLARYGMEVVMVSLRNAQTQFVILVEDLRWQDLNSEVLALQWCLPSR